MIAAAAFFCMAPAQPARSETGRASVPEVIKLPQPDLTGGIPLEKTLAGRRTVRDFKDEPLALEEISQLLWAAQGITDPRGFRTAPSAGALYPLEVYVAAGRIAGLEAGVYKYLPGGHALVKISAGDKRKELSGAAFGQEWLEEGAAVLVMAAIFEKVKGRYGERGTGYVYMEAGHAAQNVCLQAVSLNLGAGLIGAYDDTQVRRVMAMQPDERPLYVVPVGRT